MNTFFQCPYKWKLLYIDRIKVPRIYNEKAELGTCLHNVIAKYYEGLPDKVNEQTIKSRAENMLRAHFEPRLSKLQPNAKEMMQNFIDFEIMRLNDYRKPIVIEGKLRDENYTGVIDYFDGKHLIDWKSGAMMSIDKDQRIQGKIYETLLRSNGYIKEGEQIEVSFFTLKNGRNLILPFTTSAWLEQQRQTMLTMIKSGKFAKIPSRLCGWCDGQLTCELDGMCLWQKAKLFKTIRAVSK